jgi:hypothetical protein
LPNANLLEKTPHTHALLISPSGAGKTCIGAGWPGKYVCMDFEDRIRGILGVPWLNEKIARGEIEWESFVPKRGGKMLGYNDVFTYLAKLEVRVATGEVQTVQLSSTSSLIRFLISESLNNGIANKPKHYNIGQIELAQKQDYNYTAACMANIIYTNLKSFKCNVFIDSHLKDKVVAAPTETEPDRTLVVGRTLKAPGQLADEIPTWFDETWELTVDDTIKSQPPKRYVLFKSALAKTTIQGIPHKVEFTDKNLYDVIKQYVSKNEEKNGVQKT